MIDPQLAQLLMAAAQQQQQAPPPTAQQPFRMVPNGGGMDIFGPGGGPQAVPQPGATARQVMPAAPAVAPPPTPGMYGRTVQDIAHPIPGAVDQILQNRVDPYAAGVPGGGVNINHGWDPAAPPAVPAGMAQPPTPRRFAPQGRGSSTNPLDAAPQPGVGAPQAPATTGAIPPAPPVAASGTATGGWRVGLGNAAAGMAGVDTTSSGLSAFAQGFSGAQGKQAEREEAKRAEQRLSDSAAAATEERDYERGRDTADDTYRTARDTVEDRRERDKASIEAKKAKRDERELDLKEIADAAGIEKTQAEVRKIDREYSRSGMTIDQSLDLEQRVNAYGQIISKGVFTDSKKINDMMDVYRADLIKRVVSGQPLPEAPSPPGPTTGAPPPLIGSAQGGGTYESPFNLTTMPDPRGFLQSQPPGTYYINPADGKLLRTKDTGRV